MTRFTGHMRIPLDPTLSDYDIVRRSELVGDWKTKSKQILKKPRLFTVTAHIFNTNNEKAVTTVNYRSRGGNKTIAEAAIMAFDAARNGTANINMSESYIILKA